MFTQCLMSYSNGHPHSLYVRLLTNGTVLSGVKSDIEMLSLNLTRCVKSTCVTQCSVIQQVVCNCATND